MSSLVVTDIW